jgi:hypothetical protein
VRHGWLIGIALALVAPAARAEDAEALVARGIELREQGKDDQALELFRRADALSPSPRTQAQVALAEQALGIWVLAEAHLVSALAAQNDAWIEKNRAALTGALGVVHQHVGTLEVRGPADGASVFVDGAKVGVVPGSWRVEVGRRAIEVRAPGYHLASRTTDIAAGATTRETIPLVREEPGARGAVEPAKGGTQRMLGWVFVGTGSALVVTGVVGLFARQSAVSSYNDDATCPGMGSAAQPPSCEDRISTANTWRTISIASFIAGGAVGAAGVVLVLTAPAARAQAAIACAPWLGGASCAVRF